MNGYIEQLLGHAQRQMHQGNVQGAIQNLKRVLGQEPDHAIGHGLLALCLLRSKRVYAAQHEIRIAIQLEPEQPFLHFVQGHIALAARRFKDAENHFHTAAQMQPEDGDYQRGLATLYSVTGDRRRQQAALEQALALDPNNELGHADMGEFWLDGGNLQQARACAETAMALNADCQEAIVLMGNVQLALGNVAEAREHALWALRHDPTHTKTLRLMAAIKARTNRFLGLWWRFNATLTRLGETRVILVLILMYLVYRVGTQALKDFDHANEAALLSLVWLGFVIYTWVGPTLFARSLKKELDSVRLNRNF